MLLMFHVLGRLSTVIVVALSMDVVEQDRRLRRLSWLWPDAFNVLKGLLLLFNFLISTS